MKNEPPQFGEEPTRDWRDHAKTPDSKDEHEDSEDPTKEEAEFVKATLGFDPAELFKEK